LIRKYKTSPEGRDFPALLHYEALRNTYRPELALIFIEEDR